MSLGPFWRSNAPHRDERALLQGIVTDSRTGEPIDNAELDVWEAAPNGKYEQQDPNQKDMNLRGQFNTSKDGRYYFYCLRPTTYAIPDGGPAGELLKLLGRHLMIPAHIHFIVSVPDYRPVVTELFDRQDKHVHDDAGFAVRDSLIVDFLPLVADENAVYETECNFKLTKLE
ncbi:uncharacterized protein A1O9_12749, partial [Exophiala aquamarina CBS 119918]